MLYEKEYLKEISFPVGGIGSGCIGIGGNGQLIDWEIANLPDKNSENRFSNIAVRCFKNENVEDARILVGDTDKSYVANGTGLSPFTMNGFPHFEQNSFFGQYPVAELAFKDKKFPGTVKLKAFNPYIPLNSLDSSIPAAFFEIEFENPFECDAVYEAVFSVSSMFRESLNQCLETDDGIIMYDASDKNNNISIIAQGEKIGLCDYWYRGWFKSFFKDNVRAFWQDFSSGQPLKIRSYADCGNYDVCSVSARVTVPAGKKGSVRFVLTWSFPERFNYWAPLKDASGKDVTWRNFYATVWENSEKSAVYCRKNWNRLYSETMEFTNSLYSSTLSDEMKASIASALSVLKSPTVLRLEDGSLYGFEGTVKGRGSCEGTCQHVWNYAYVCCYLFPDLEIGLRDNEYRYSLYDSGEMVFRMAIPLGRKEPANLFPPGEEIRPCVDGQMGEIIKTYREWKLSGNTKWLESHWQDVKKTLEFAWSSENNQKWDYDCDGVMEGRQHHTLDIELFGPSGWLQGFYLAALKAASEMAEAVDDIEAAEHYKSLFENGSNYTKNNLFNGDYFIQRVDIEDKTICDSFGCSYLFWNEENNEISYQIADGCLIDQLAAQWHAVLCGIGDVFDSEQARTAAFNIYKNNYKTSMRDVVNPWRLFSVNDDGGTVICSYPDGAYMPLNPIPYAEETMSGFEYVFAGVLLINGYLNEAENVIKTVRKRYDGKRGNPWNDTECGHNYARSMAAFAFVPLMAGFTADLYRKELKFSPLSDVRPFKTIWNTATGWGTAEIFTDKTKICIKSGKICLASLNLPYITSVSKVIINGGEVDFKANNGIVKFPQLQFDANSIIEIYGE